MNISVPQHAYRKFRGRSWPRFLVVVCLLCTLFIGQLMWRSQAVAQNVDTQSEEWAETASLLLNSSENGFTAIWNDLQTDILDALDPITGLTGDALINYELRKVEELSRKWIEAVEPLQGYSLIDDQPTQEVPFSDQLFIFFQENEELVQETRQWWNSTFWWRLLLSVQSSVRNTLDRVEDVIDLIEYIFDNADILLEALGHVGRKTYLIVTQNPGEARPTGGFIGSYIPVEVVKGSVNIGDSQSIYFVDGSKPQPIETHPATSYYLYSGRDAYSHGIRNLNFFPCWPDSASDIAREFEASSVGFTPDGIISVNPFVLEQLIPEDTIIEIPDVGAVNSLNILDEIERVTSFEAPDESNPKSLLSPILSALLADSVSFEKLVEIVIESIYSRNILAWSSDEQVQSILSDQYLAGEHTCQNGKDTPIVTPLIGNISIDKRNSITNNYFDIRSEPTFRGKKVTVRYSQFLPDNPDLERPFRLDESKTFVGLQVPEYAENINVSGGLELPSVRPFYKEYIELNDRDADLKMPENVSTIYSSLTEVEGGFTYSQPDGSKVIGTYVRDDIGYTHVEFSFTLPSLTPGFVFFGQPGLNNPLISFSGDAFLDGGDQGLVYDQSFIQRGIIVNI